MPDDLDKYLDPAPRKSRGYDDLIERHARENSVDPNLVRAIIGQESGGNPKAVSPKKARGLMQLMPGTAQRFGTKNIHDPEENIRGGTRYLKFLNDRFKGDTDLVLAGYNAGEGAVEKFGNKIPPYKETRNYVPAVKARYWQLTGKDPQKPELDSYLDPLESYLDQSAPPKSRINVHRPKSLPAPEVDPMEIARQAGGAVIGQAMDRKRPPAIPQSARSGLLAPKQPVMYDPTAATAQAQRRAQSAHFTPSSQAGLPIPPTEAAQVQAKKNAVITRRVIEAAAPPGFKHLPKDMQEWIGSGVASVAGSFATSLAGVATDRLAVSPATRLTNVVGSKVTGVDAGAKLMEIGNILSQGSTTMDEEAKRSAVSQIPKDVLFGSIASAPAMALAALGVPAPIAFGMQGYLSAEGRGAELSDTITETGAGATIGALFELPIPQKMQILSRIGQKVGPKTATVGRAIERAVPVGAGTYGVETAVGSPHALQSAAVNALFAGSGAIRHERVRGEGREAKVETQPNVEAQLEGARAGTTQVPPSVSSVEGRRVDTSAAEPAVAKEPAVETVAPRHVDLQPRRVRGEGKGEFKKETRAQAEERRQQVNPPQGESVEVAPTTQPEPRIVDLPPERRREYHQLRDEDPRYAAAKSMYEEALPKDKSTRLAAMESAERWFATRYFNRPEDVLPTGLAIPHNRAQLDSPKFREVRMLESIGGNAGPDRLAVNMAVDRDGRIVAIGNIQDLAPKTQQRMRRGELYSVAAIVRYPDFTIERFTGERTPESVLNVLKASVQPETPAVRRVSAGSVPEDIKAGLQSGVLKAEGNLVFDPKRISREEIREAIMSNRVDDLLRSSVQPETPSVAPKDLVQPVKPDTPPAEISTPPSSAPTPAAVPLKPVKPESPRPSITSARKEMMKSDRAELDLPELPAAERKSWRQSLDEAKPESANRLAEEVLRKPRALSDSETASMVVRAQQVKNEHAAKMKEVYEATDADAIAAKRVEAEVLEAEFDKLTEATKASGAEKGRTLAAQKLTINQDFDLISVKARMKAAKGRPLTEKENARYEDMVKQRDQAIVERDAALEKARTNQIQKNIDRVQRRRVRAETKEALDEEAALIKQNIVAEFARIRSQNIQASGLAGLDPEGVITSNLLRYTRNRVKANVGIKAEQLIDDVHSLVKDFVDRRQVAELISGYKLAVPEKQAEDVRRLAEIRSEIQATLKAIDIEKGVRSPRREGPTKGEARRLPMEGPRLSEGVGKVAGPQLGERQGPRLSEGIGRPEGPQLGTRQGPTLREGVGPKEGPSLGPKQGPQKSEAKQLPAEGPSRRFVSRNEQKLKQLQKKEAELVRRIEESDFSKRTKPEPLPYTREVQRAQERVTILENKFKREEERARPGHQLRNIAGVWKVWLLSSPSTQAMNTLGTGSYQAFREVSRLPAAVADAVWSGTRKTFGYGAQRSIQGPSPSAMLDSVLYAGKVGGREALETLRMGAPREVMERHQYQEIDFGVNTGIKGIDNGVKVIELAHNAIFRLMSASDRVFYQGAKQRNLLDRAAVQAKNEGLRGREAKERAKELADNPTTEMDADAKHDALVSTFNNNNFLSQRIRQARAARVHNRLVSERSAERINAAENMALDFILPFDRTPTNVLFRIVEASPAGYVKNAGQLIAAAVRRSMSPEHQRQMMQTFGNATTGTALMALGWFIGDSLIDVDEKGNVYLKIPKLPRINLRTASPAGNVVAMGARLRKNYEEDAGGYDYVKTVGREVTNQPLLRATSTITDLGQEPERSIPKIGARYAASAIPFSGAVRFAAQTLDPEDARYPKATSFKEQFQQNIPGWRQKLPSSKDGSKRPASKRKSGRSASTRPSRAALLPALAPKRRDNLLLM